MKHKNFLKKLTAGILGFVMTLGVGAAGYAASSNETMAATDYDNKEFKKITGDVTAGDYLIVCPTGNKVFNGADASGDYVTATVSDSKITYQPGMAVISIEGVSGGWSLKISVGTNSGKYIYGKSGSNSIQFGTSASACTISNSSGAYTITNNSTSFRFNKTSGSSNDRFRFYKTNTTGDNYVVPNLYKLVEASKTLSSIAVSNNHRTFTVGDTSVKETVTATYSDNSTADVTNSATFTVKKSGASSYESIPLTFDRSYDGATIKASFTDGGVTKTADYTIEVHYATVISITVSPNTYSLGVSGTLDLTTIDVTILPGNADQSSYEWTIFSINPNTMECTLSGTTFSAGNVAGTAVLRCTAGSQHADLTVTISEGAFISLDKTEVEGIANISSDAEVNATVYNYQSITSSYTWSSNNSGVASVSGTSTKGTIKFLYEGSATITCSVVVVNLLGVSETVSETVSVTVTKQLTSISAVLKNSSKTYPENTNVPAEDLTVTATYSDGQSASVDTTDFTVSEPLVTMEDNSIKVSCTQGGVTVHTNVTVTVVRAVLDSLSFTGRKTTFTHGDKFTIGESAVVTAKYETSFSDETLVSNGVIQSNLRGTLTFKLMSKNGDVYTEVATLVPGTTEMLRSYNGLYTRAYYTYEGSTKYSQAQAIQVAAPRTTVDVTEELDESWSLVTAASQLEEDANYVIAASGYDVAMSDTQNSNNRGETSITKSGSTISWTETSNVQVFTLKEGNTTGSWAFDTGSGYIYAASSSSNYLRTESVLSDNSSFKIEFTNGATSIVAQGSNSRNVLQYNQSATCFSCYGSASQKAVVLYKHVGGKTTTPYAISEDLYDAIAALPSPLTNDWSSLNSLSSFVAEGKENTDDYKVLTKGKANASGNMAEQFLAEYDSVCGPQEKTNYLSPRATLDPEYSIAYGNVTGATLSGGTDAGTYTKNTTIELPTASKTGYENATWWTLDGSSTEIWGTQVTESFSLVKNTTIFAKWTPIEYTINYELDGGTNHADNPSTYTIEDAITLKAPSKAGCDFSAWSNGGVIEKGSTGNKTFTASWNPLPQNISFNGTHVTSSGASTCLLGAQYNATFTAEDSYVLPSTITVKLNGEDYSDYSYSSVDGSFSIASMPAGTISISVTAQQGAYQITYKEVDGTVITEPQLVKEYEFGVGATLVDAQDRLGFNFVGWYSEPELINKIDSIGSGEKGNKDFYAKWAFGAQDALNNVKSSIGMSFTYQKDANAPIVSSSTPPTKAETRASTAEYHYEKVASTLADYSGTYLFVYINSGSIQGHTNYVFDGTGSASSDNGVTCPIITNDQISGSSTIGTDNVSKYEVQIQKVDGGYTLKCLNTGKYIYPTADKTIAYGNDPVTLDITDGVISKTFGSDVSKLQWYVVKGSQETCKFYKSSQKPLQLFKRVEDKKVVTSIEIVGTPSKTTYNVGEAYSAAGLSVVATYEDDSQETVEATITPNKQYAEAGDTSVTFSATYEDIPALDFPVNVTVNSVYSNVSFKFNFKNTGMDALVEEYRDVYDDMGLVVEYDGRTRYFSFIPDQYGNYYIYEYVEDKLTQTSTFKMKDGGMFTLSLGDMINDENDRASIVFTVKAYIRVGETYYYSSNSESYSVKSWIEYYHSQSAYKDATEDLYNIFFPSGK